MYLSFLCISKQYSNFNLQVFNILLFFLEPQAFKFVWASCFLFFWVIPPLCLNKQSAKSLMRAQWAAGPCEWTWRLWERKGRLVNEYEGPSYYNFPSDK